MRLLALGNLVAKAKEGSVPSGLRAIGPSMAAGTKYFVGHGHFGAWARLPLIGSLSISTQPPYPAQVQP